MAKRFSHDVPSDEMIQTVSDTLKEEGVSLGKVHSVWVAAKSYTPERHFSTVLPIIDTFVLCLKNGENSIPKVKHMLMVLFPKMRKDVASSTIWLRHLAEQVRLAMDGIGVSRKLSPRIAHQLVQLSETDQITLLYKIYCNFEGKQINFCLAWLKREVKLIKKAKGVPVKYNSLLSVSHMLNKQMEKLFGGIPETRFKREAERLAQKLNDSQLQQVTKIMRVTRAKLALLEITLRETKKMEQSSA